MVGKAPSNFPVTPAASRVHPNSVRTANRRTSCVPVCSESTAVMQSANLHGGRNQAGDAQERFLRSMSGCRSQCPAMGETERLRSAGADRAMASARSNTASHRWQGESVTWLGAMGGHGMPRIIRPRMARIASLQFLFYLGIGALPEAAQVLRHLDGPAGG